MYAESFELVLYEEAVGELIAHSSYVCSYSGYERQQKYKSTPNFPEEILGSPAWDSSILKVAKSTQT